MVSIVNMLDYIYHCISVRFLNFGIPGGSRKKPQECGFFYWVISVLFPAVFHLLSGQKPVDVFEVFGHFPVAEFIHFFSQAIQKIPVV